jgi:outer membrane protein TolC
MVAMTGRHLLLPLMVAAISGCTPTTYRDWADRDVNKLIRDRQEKSLGYTTPTPPQDLATTRPASSMFARLPVTELPELKLNPITRTIATLKAQPPGPEVPGDESQMSVSANVEFVRRFSKELLTAGPEAEAQDTVPVGLFESVAYGVRNSRDYQDQAELVYLSALSVTLQRHLFSPRPTAGIAARYNGAQADNQYRSAYTVTADAGVRQQLPYGGQIEAGMLVDLVNALNETSTSGESAQASLSAAIPLLRGAGFVNLEGLIQSERDLVYAVRAFENYRRSFVVDVASSYFRLLARQQQLRNRSQRYNSLIELTNRTRALFAAGRITALEVQRSEQELLQAEDDVNTAVESFQSELDRFKLQIGMPVGQAVRIVPVNVEVDASALELPNVQELASRYRLELQTARDRVDDARRGVENAKNGLLPQLDLTARAQLNNTTGEPANQINSDTMTYSGGVRLDLPVDRLPERNAYRRALISQTRSIRDLEDNQELVRSDVRRAIRSIRAARATVLLQTKGIEIARQRLDNANESLLTGRTTDSRNVVEAQNSLLLAQDRLDQARTNLQIQILQFLRDTGLLRLDPDSNELGTVILGG